MKKMFLKLCIIHWKTPVLDSHFRKAIGMKAFRLIKKRLQSRYDPVNSEKFSGTPILKNTWEQRLLYTVSYFGENVENKPKTSILRNVVRNHIPWWKMI